MLVLHIEKKWFDLILLCIKGEEYREIKPYYISRFKNILNESNIANIEFISKYRLVASEPFTVKFINGYGSKKPFIVATVTLTVDTGYEDWGANADEEYFVLTIDKILETGNIFSPVRQHDIDKLENDMNNSNFELNEETSMRMLNNIIRRISEDK